MPSAVFLPDITSLTVIPYVLRTVTKQGATINTLTLSGDGGADGSWVIEEIEEVYNEAGGFTISCSVHSAEAAYATPRTEVQVWRNGTCVAWGFIHRIQADHERMTVQCRGLLGYFDKRFFGDYQRHNYLADPSFELGTVWDPEGVTTTYVENNGNDPVILGDYSVKLDQATPGVDTYISQAFNIVTHELGSLVTFAAWYWIAPLAWQGPAIEERGLFVGLYNEALDLMHYDWTTITEETPRGVWQRTELEVWVPPIVNWIFEVRLYAVGGVIWWDATQAVEMESIGNSGADRSGAVARIVNYAQDLDAWAHGKSNLYITATAETCPPTGVYHDYWHQFADHENVGDVLREYTNMDNGLDIGITFDGTNRFFRTYYPQRGSSSSVASLTQGDYVQGPFDVVYDGDHYANSVLILGEGSGPDREEGFASAHDLFAGDLVDATFEKVQGSRSEATINRLTPQAREELATALYPESITISFADRVKDLYETLQVGDVIDAEPPGFFPTVAPQYRVITKTLNPQNEVVTLQCQAVPATDIYDAVAQ